MHIQGEEKQIELFIKSESSKSLIQLWNRFYEGNSNEGKSSILIYVVLNLDSITEMNQIFKFPGILHSTKMRK